MPLSKKINIRILSSIVLYVMFGYIDHNSMAIS